LEVLVAALHRFLQQHEPTPQPTSLKSESTDSNNSNNSSTIINTNTSAPPVLSLLLAAVAAQSSTTPLAFPDASPLRALWMVLDATVEDIRALDRLSATLPRADDPLPTTVQDALSVKPKSTPKALVQINFRAHWPLPRTLDERWRGWVAASTRHGVSAAMMSAVHTPGALSTWQHATFDTSSLISSLTTTAVASGPSTAPIPLTLAALLTPSAHPIATFRSPVQLALHNLARGRLVLGWGSLLSHFSHPYIS
jgi:hypothetical protein